MKEQINKICSGQSIELSLKAKAEDFLIASNHMKSPISPALL